jgi:hypothetical protein
MRPSVAIALALALAFGGASAQGPTSPSQNAASLHDYGDGDKTCQEWTDGCRTCRRADEGEPSCSNIGIACQPKGIACARRTEPVK